MSVSPRVLLTPLAISDDQGHFVCIAIRDPETDEIVDTVVTSYDLAEKADIPLEEARRITSINSVHSFQAAQATAERRLANT